MPDASDERAPLPAQAAAVKAAAGTRFERAGGFWTGRKQLANVEAVPVFAIHCIDKPMQQSLRASTRAEHLAYLESQIDRVVVAGPLLDDEGAPIGSMMLMDFPDRRAAVAFAADDPYAKAGLFASVAVTAWRQVLPRTS